MLNPNSIRASRDGVDLYLRQWTPSNEPKGVVCLLHGLGEHCGRYNHVADALKTENFVVIAMDLRGHGKSLGRRGDIPSYEAILDDIDLLLEEARTRYPHLPLFLYGHSMGGNLALNYALRRHPELCGIIATGSWLRLAYRLPILQKALIRLLYIIHPRMALSNQLNLQGLSHDSRVAEAYINDPLVHDKISIRLFFSVVRSGEWAIDHGDELNIPLLLMHGGGDPITSAEATREFGGKARNSRVKIWDDLYHEIHNESQNEEVFRAITDWLNERLTPN